VFRTAWKRIAAATIAAGWITGTAFSGCTALVRVPTGQLDVSDEGVFIDFPGALVSVTHQRITIDLLGIEVELNSD